MRIELLQNGYPCQVIAESAPNTGSYVWADIIGCDPEDWAGYSIRVTDLTSGAADESDGTFSMTLCGGGEE